MSENKQFLKHLYELAEYYNFNMDQYIGHRYISVGHINTTLILYFDFGNKVKRYLVQRINTKVFKNPYELMENINDVTIYAHDLLKGNGIDNYKNRFLRVYLTKNKKSFVKTSLGYYRVYHYVENGVSYDQTNDPTIVYNAGKAIGEFQNILAGYNANYLHDTIKNFHNTPYRYTNFVKLVNSLDSSKTNLVKDEIDFIINNKDIAYSIQPLLDKKIMPTRVTHNDTKINNIMFNFNTNEGLCLLDLDTIMKGSVCYDFGDFIRTACNMGKEDEKDLSKVIFNKELFISFAKGYLESVKDTITKVELENLTMGAILMTYECGLRFLEDYLKGNKYFKVEYPTHNLDRSRTQICFVKQLIESKDELDKEIARICKK